MGIAIAIAVAAGLSTESRAASLQELFEGEYLPGNGFWFDGWELVATDVTSGAALNFDAMTVNLLNDQPGNPGLQFGFGQQLAISGVNAIDLTFRFRAHSVIGANSFAAHSLNLTGLNFVGPGGIAVVSQEVSDLNGGDLGSAVAIADNVNDVFQFNDAKTIAPHLNLTVTMNLFLQGLAGNDSFSLTAFNSRFSQSGPSTVAGDFNGDRTVDGTDFLRWQRGLSPTPMSSQDLAAWRNNFGKSIVAVPAVGAVPEPYGAGMLLGGVFVVWRWRRSRGWDGRRRSCHPEQREGSSVISDSSLRSEMTLFRYMRRRAPYCSTVIAITSGAVSSVPLMSSTASISSTCLGAILK